MLWGECAARARIQVGHENRSRGKAAVGPRRPRQARAAAVTAVYTRSGFNERRVFGQGYEQVLDTDRRARYYDYDYYYHCYTVYMRVCTRECADAYPYIPTYVCSFYYYYFYSIRRPLRVVAVHLEISVMVASLGGLRNNTDTLLSVHKSMRASL